MKKRFHVEAVRHYYAYTEFDVYAESEEEAQAIVDDMCIDFGDVDINDDIPDDIEIGECDLDDDDYEEDEEE